MSQAVQQGTTVVKKIVATGAATTASSSFALLAEVGPVIIGCTGTIVGACVTIYFAIKKRTILQQEEKLNAQQIRINELQILDMENDAK